MKAGDLVRWLDPWKIKRLGLVHRRIGHCTFPATESGAYYDVLVDGKIEFCHRSNLELISESR